MARQAYGGSLDSAPTIAASAAPRVAYQGSFSGVDIRAMLADPSSHPPRLEGRGELAWALRRGGSGVGSLRNGVAGRMTTALQSASVSGIDLRTALPGAQAEFGTEEAIRKRAANFGALARFSQMRTRLEVHDGRAKAQVFVLHSESLHAADAGELALGSGLLDMRLDTSVLGGAWRARPGPAGRRTGAAARRRALASAVVQVRH